MLVTSIRETYGVETEMGDWPKGLNQGQRDELVEAVYVVLARCPQGLPPWLIMRQPEVERVLGGVPDMLWRSAVVERACRALPTADKRWVLEK